MSDMAKVFWNGRSQAVRLPKEYRFQGSEVSIRKEDGKVILEPVVTDPWSWLSRLRPMDDDAVAAAVDRPGAETLPEGPSLD